MITVDKVKIGIYTWGFYPALFLLMEFQEKEDYELCKVIKEALDMVGFGREWYLSPKVDNDSMDETYDNILQTMKNPETIHTNMDIYIDKFRDYLMPVSVTPL